MTIEGALYQYVSGLPAIQALIGNPARLYRDILPEEVAYPAVTFHRVSTPHEHTLDIVTGGAVSEFRSPRFQFDAWSADVADTTGATRSGADDVLNITEALHAALEGFRGDMSGVAVRGILSDEEGDRGDYEASTRSYHRMIDFEVMIDA